MKNNKNNNRKLKKRFIDNVVIPNVEVMKDDI